MNLESTFPHECPAGTSNSIHPEETHYWWPYYSSPLLMVPRAVNGLAFIQSPAVQSPAPFLTFLSAFHPTYNYSLVFSNSVRKTRIIFFPLVATASPLRALPPFPWTLGTASGSGLRSPMWPPSAVLSLDYRCKHLTSTALNPWVASPCLQNRVQTHYQAIQS